MKQDKRRHPRVAQKIRVRSSSREAVEFETIDLSAGGFCCTAPAFLAPMTKLAVSLVLPHHGPGPHRNGGDVVSCEAVVVRTDPPGQDHDGHYRLALFFSRMDDADRQRLHDFLAHHVGKPNG
jgi:c-di-GMP-binding flagellar brake protein YcgR